MKPFSGGYICFNIMLHQGSTRSTKIYNNAIFKQFTKEKGGLYGYCENTFQFSYIFHRKYFTLFC